MPFHELGDLPALHSALYSLQPHTVETVDGDARRYPAGRRNGEPGQGK